MADDFARAVPYVPLGRELSAQRQAFRRCINDLDSSGSTLEFDVKAVVYASGEVFWGGQVVVADLVRGREGDWRAPALDNHGDKWNGFWELAGLRPAEAWLRGQRSKQDDVPKHAQRFVRQSSSWTALGLVSLLVGESVLGATLRRQSVYMHMLRGFL